MLFYTMFGYICLTNSRVPMKISNGVVWCHVIESCAPIRTGSQKVDAELKRKIMNMFTTKSSLFGQLSMVIGQFKSIDCTEPISWLDKMCDIRTLPVEEEKNKFMIIIYFNAHILGYISVIALILFKFSSLLTFLTFWHNQLTSIKYMFFLTL